MKRHSEYCNLQGRRTKLIRGHRYRTARAAMCSREMCDPSGNLWGPFWTYEDGEWQPEPGVSGSWLHRGGR